MANTLTRKKPRRKSTRRTKVADMTREELRDMIETLIDRKLSEIVTDEPRQ